MSAFNELCLIAVSSTISTETADAVNEAILTTQEGKEAVELLGMYHDGRITLAEFYVKFIALTLM